MKTPSLLIPILAAIALFAQPVFAEDAHSHGTTAQAAQGEPAGPAEKTQDHASMMQAAMEKMHAQMAAINKTKDPKKRLKLLQEHSQSMRDSLKMMHEMMGDMAMGCPMMGGAMKGGCMMMGGGMKEGCMMGGAMKGGCMMGGAMKEGCMMGGAMKGGCMMGGGMKGGGMMMGGNPASPAGGDASAAPAAQTNPDQAATAGQTAKKEGGKLWTCPMHPDVVRDQPGTCPICGMDLVEMDPSGASPSGHGHMMGGCMMGRMMEMSGKHMDMMLMLMEQMIEHDEAAMAARK